MSIYLASASPRRHELLKQIGVEHEILHVPAPEGEDEPRLINEPAYLYVQRTAKDKARYAAQYIDKKQLPRKAILTADTSVIMGEQIFGKPQDESDIVHTLEQLSGRTHEVHTSVVLHHDGVFYQKTNISQVQFKRLSKTDIALYLTSQEAWGKAGAYGIQGLAGIFIEKISGSYSGIMGLPLYETYALLQESGLYPR